MSLAARYTSGDGERVALALAACQAHHPSTLDLLCPGAPVELRILTDRMSVRRFDRHADALSWVERSPSARATYVVLNPYDSSRIKGVAVDDASITRRRWLLIDVDSTRPADTNATEQELRTALAVVRSIALHLDSLGWPAPVVCMSGNGWHLLYRIDLPNDGSSLALVEAVLRTLARKFDVPGARVDTTVANASRITKLYGSMVRKGPSTSDRPHRASRLDVVPRRIECLHADTLRKAAELKAGSVPEGAPDHGQRLYDVAGILAKLEVFRKVTKAGTTYYDIRCPWQASHSSQPDGPSGTVFTVGADGAVGFKCQHNHCADKRWPDLRTHLGIESARPRLELIRASDVTVVKLEWLWSARLARGAITLVEGAAEKGKSTVLVDLAARVSRGHSFPGDHQTRAPGNVVMMIAEDDLQTTVVPRLLAAGADLERVYFLGATKNERGEVVPFHLSDDCERLRAKCDEVEALFVVVDPLVSYLGSRKGRVLNTNNDLEVRKSLAPLKELAEHLKASVAAIRHYRKGNGTDALEAGGGSVGFAALVRVIIAALPDPRADDDQHYLLAVAKNNLVAKNKRPALGYEIVPWDGDPDIGRIAWGDSVDMSAGEILQAHAEAAKDTTGKAAEATAFLEEFLRSGEWIATTEILSAAKEAAGLSEDAVRRARMKLPIKAEKHGKPWFWRLEGGMGDVPF